MKMAHDPPSDMTPEGRGGNEDFDEENEDGRVEVGGDLNVAKEGKVINAVGLPDEEGKDPSTGAHEDRLIKHHGGEEVDDEDINERGEEGVREDEEEP